MSSDPSHRDEGPESSLDLGPVLALLRTAAGWTEDDLAQASGLPSSSITACERGKMVPGLHFVDRVLRALGYPLVALDLARTCIETLRSFRRTTGG